ncbi:cytochrome c oxidase assembly protein [Virgibacillus sp. MSJ-26]|uniref:cytochrome c oxidase assembly protein n=1 Tax=Virgibacillus sp. MSJ-26 TaxID=2841522 RepID=UPI00209E37B6|nr:cytochrome c oxidase assembly protein [Virgibacillus sp. MSJ-26]
MGSIFQGFAWYEIVGPLWLALVIWLGYSYNKHIIKSPEYDVGSGRVKYFYTGLVLLYLLHGSPFSIIADHYLFSALMLQMSLTYFVVVPLLIIGLPFKWFKKYAWNHKLRLSIKVAGHPWLTLVIFSGMFTVYFIPSVFNVIHASIILTLTVKIVMLVYAFFMWWAIINPVRRLNDLAPLVRIGYIFFASLALMPIGFFFLLVLTAHYPAYQGTVGDIFPVMTAVYDQQLAGGLLKLIQLSSFIFAMYKIVQGWVWREEDEGHAYDKNFRVVQGVVIRVDDEKK